MANETNTMHGAKPAIQMDPLIQAIQAYRAGLAAYNAAGDDLPDDDEAELHSATIGGPDAVLSGWKKPAVSRDAAIAAISLAEEELVQFGGSPVATAMKAAALAYWDTDARLPHGNVTAPLISLDSFGPDVHLTPGEAAAYLRVSVPTLARWRGAKGGPLHAKIGSKVFYRVSSLREYLATNQRRGTRPDA